MTDQRNLILAIVLSALILFGWSFFIEGPRIAEQQAQEQAALEAQQDATPEDLEGLSGTELENSQAALDALMDDAGAVSRTDALADAPRVPIDTQALHGSISLRGGRIDDLTLGRYHETVDPSSPEVVLFSPVAGPDAYYADFGWLTDSGMPVPTGETLWQAQGDVLNANDTVTLTWDNGAGLRFEREISLDEDYLFTVTQRVVNTGDTPVALAPYGRIARLYRPETLNFFILHEGPYGIFDGTLEEYSYNDLEDDGRISYDTTGGWLGFTDKYWLAALIPDQQTSVETQFTYTESGLDRRYLATYRGTGAQALAVGGTLENTVRLFAGAKEFDVIDRYDRELNIEKFELAIDFGWFYFLTKPFFLFLNFIQDLVGNFGVAILVVTVIIKAIFFPLANSSYKAMSKMKALQPEMQRLREVHGDDRQRMSQELMELYKREKVNPAAGCLPILIQIPVFFALYKVLFVNIEMRHAPFFGWIQDLSAPDPTSLFNLFGLLPYDVPGILMIGIWPLLMGGTMFLQQKLNPAPADPMQAKIFMFLPVVFTILLASFPAGLVIYWTWNNLLSIAQQWIIMKRMGVKIGGGMETPAPAKTGKAKGQTAKPEESAGEAAPAADPEAPAGPAADAGEASDGDGRNAGVGDGGREISGTVKPKKKRKR